MEQKISVFIADDHPIVMLGVTDVIEKHPRMQLAGKASSSIELFENLPIAKPNIILLDLNMPGDDYIRNIKRIQEEYPWAKIIAYTQYNTSDLVRNLMKNGVLGFLPKTATRQDIADAIEIVFAGQTYVHSEVRFGDTSTSVNIPADLGDDFRKRLGLSKREQEILVLITKGLTSQLIGKTLFISKHTVETHRKNILRKLDFNSSTELVRFAVQQGLV